jgi:hypothetical protein
MPIVKTVSGQVEAVIIKGRLESENIPVQLSYDSAGAIYGFSSTYLGEVKIIVPEAFESAARIICGTEKDAGPHPPDGSDPPGGGSEAA